MEHIWTSDKTCFQLRESPPIYRDMFNEVVESSLIRLYDDEEHPTRMRIN